MERKLLRQFRKVGAQHFLGFLHNEVAARARGYTTEHQQVTEVIHVCVVGQRVAEIHADGLKNLKRPRVALLMQVLNKLELLGGVSLQQLNPCRCREPCDRLLRKALYTTAD